jgi:hypothetical protein
MRPATTCTLSLTPYIMAVAYALPPRLVRPAISSVWYS